MRDFIADVTDDESLQRNIFSTHAISYLIVFPPEASRSKPPPRGCALILLSLSQYYRVTWLKPRQVSSAMEPAVRADCHTTVTLASPAAGLIRKARETGPLGGNSNECLPVLYLPSVSRSLSGGKASCMRHLTVLKRMCPEWLNRVNLLDRRIPNAD